MMMMMMMMNTTAAVIVVVATTTTTTTTTTTENICRMDDKRLVQTAVFEVTEGENKRGRINREWLDDL